jgi:arylsulfatase A-like enzyme
MKNVICMSFVLTAFLYSAVSILPSQASYTRGKKIRNVLFIMGDEHSAEVLGCYGNKIIQTLNLDQLVLQGTRFNQDFVNAPLCTQSRQSLITGKLPHADRVTQLQTPLGNEQVTLAEHLKAIGAGPVNRGDLRG